MLLEQGKDEDVTSYGARSQTLFNLLVRLGSVHSVHQRCLAWTRGLVALSQHRRDLLMVLLPQTTSFESLMASARQFEQEDVAQQRLLQRGRPCHSSGNSSNSNSKPTWPTLLAGAPSIAIATSVNTLAISATSWATSRISAASAQRRASALTAAGVVPMAISRQPAGRRKVDSPKHPLQQSPLRRLQLQKQSKRRTLRAGACRPTSSNAHLWVTQQPASLTYWMVLQPVLRQGAETDCACACSCISSATAVRSDPHPAAPSITPSHPSENRLVCSWYFTSTGIVISLLPPILCVAAVFPFTLFILLCTLPPFVFLCHFRCHPPLKYPSPVYSNSPVPPSTFPLLSLSVS